MIQPKQTSLFKNNTHIPFGVYEDLITNVDTGFWDKQGLIIKKRRTERKAWIFFGVFSPDLICGFAIADAGMVATAFSYFYSLKDGVFEEDKTTVPLGFANDFNPNLDSEWKLGNYSIKTENGKMHLQYTGKYKMYIEAENTANGASIVVPSKDKRPFNFTYKNVCVYDRNNKQLASPYFSNISLVENAYGDMYFRDTWYYSTSNIEFYEKSVRDTMYGRNTVFSYRPDEDSKVILYISQDEKRPFKTNHFVAKIYDASDLCHKLIATNTYYVKEEWYWTFVSVYFDRKGKYYIELYNDDDVFINSASLEIR